MDNQMIERCVSVEVPSIERRVSALEKTACDMSDVQARLGVTTERMDLLSATVDKQGDRIDASLKNTRGAYDVFIKDVRRTNTAFVRWLIGVVLASLLAGLAVQYQAFHDVFEAIHRVEKKLLIESGTLPKDKVP